MSEETKSQAPEAPAAAVAVPESVQETISESEPKKTEVNTEEKTEEAAEKSEDKPEVSEKDQTAEIVKQVEFYFSDANLPKDKFLWSAVQSNEEGYVPIETIAMFNRMKKFRPLENIVAALRTLDQLVVSENGELVKRKNKLNPPNEEEQREALNRTAYVKGFPTEAKPDLDWQKELEVFFAQYGKPTQIRLRKDRVTKRLKGDAFVEFATKEEAEAFLVLDPKPKYEDSELAIMSKASFIKMKLVEKQFTGKKSGKGKGKGKRGGRKDRVEKD